MIRNNILILSGAKGDTRRYRNYHTYEQIILAGLRVELSHITDKNLLVKSQSADVIILHRSPYDHQVDRLIQGINHRGCLLIQDVDDFIFAMRAFSWIDSPDFQDPIRAALYKEDLANNGRTLAASHSILTSTDFLASVVRESGKLAYVHRNAFSLEMLAHSDRAFVQAHRDPSKVIIGYASGSPTHNKDFGVARSALKRILRHYPQVELHLIGPLDPGAEWGELSNRIHSHPMVPWRQLPEILATFDINLAPLVADNPFGQSKSEIKWMEAGLVHVPTVASPTDAFKFAITDGENGFLAYSEDEWFDKLARLVEKPGERLAIGERAYQDVLERYHPAVRAAQLVNTLNEIHQEKFGTPLVEKPLSVPEVMARVDQIPWLSPEIEKHPTLAEMAWYNLRQHGVLNLVRRVWAYTRRKLAPVFPYKAAKDR